MQSFKLIKSLNQESEEPNDTPHTFRAGMLGQLFFIELFQYAVGDTYQNNRLGTQMLVDTVAICSFINSYTFTEIEKIQPLVVTPLENPLWLQLTCHTREKKYCDSICISLRVHLF